MTDRRALHAKLEAKLKEARIPFEHLQVYGAIATNVTIRCLGRDTAERWGALLATAFGVTPQIVESSWEAKANNGTSLRPTMRRGFLVSLRV